MPEMIRSWIAVLVLALAAPSAIAASAASPADTQDDALGTVMAGEFALQAGQLPEAARWYLDAAKRGDDAGLAERATRIALLAKDDARAAEALARSGVGRITLVDMDHIAESNVNRQVHALDTTLGQAKVLAMRERMLAIHPGAQVVTIDDFVDAVNWTRIVGDAQAANGPLSAVIDACDQMAAKTTMAAWSLLQHTPLVVAGLVAKHGVAGNWLWWSWAISHVSVAVVFAALWRRSRVLTDAELIELRYAGRSGAFRETTNGRGGDRHADPAPRAGAAAGRGAPAPRCRCGRGR